MHGQASRNRRRVSVLLADPTPDSRLKYGAYLAGVGCHVAFASNSDAMLAQSLSAKPDVITISHQLRPLDGPQCCERLKRDDRTAAIPVIILTATTNVATLRTAHDAGCDVLMIQPVSPEDLFRTIRESAARAKQLVARAHLAVAHSRSLANRTARTDETRRARDGPIHEKGDSTFDAGRFLDATERSRHLKRYQSGETIYAQGDRCDTVLFVKQGVVKLSVVSRAGREAVVGLLGPGDFFGEGCLTGQPVRMGSATTVTASTILRLEKTEMQQLLREDRGLSARFITHMLARNSRVEEDLVDQLFNSTEKRLARTLLLLARYGKQDTPIRSIPPLSQGTLADMVGTTRSRINFFMRKFERLGFIEYKNGLKVNKGLLTVVLGK